MLRNFNVDSATSLAASVDGTAIPVDKNYEGFTIAAVISSASSLNGTLKLQAAIDAAATPTNWFDITAATTVTADGVTGWDINSVNYRWVRVVYTRTGGSGTMTTTFNENM